MKFLLRRAYHFDGEWRYRNTILDLNSLEDVVKVVNDSYAQDVNLSIITDFERKRWGITDYIVYCISYEDPHAEYDN